MEVPNEEVCGPKNFAHGRSVLARRFSGFGGKLARQPRLAWRRALSRWRFPWGRRPLPRGQLPQQQVPRHQQRPLWWQRQQPPAERVLWYAAIFGLDVKSWIGILLLWPTPQFRIGTGLRKQRDSRLQCACKFRSLFRATGQLQRKLEQFESIHRRIRIRSSTERPVDIQRSVQGQRHGFKKRFRHQLKICLIVRRKSPSKRPAKFFLWIRARRMGFWSGDPVGARALDRHESIGEQSHPSRPELCVANHRRQRT
jgi:hypothetical protein